MRICPAEAVEHAGRADPNQLRLGEAAPSTPAYARAAIASSP